MVVRLLPPEGEVTFDVFLLLVLLPVVVDMVSVFSVAKIPPVFSITEVAPSGGVFLIVSFTLPPPLTVGLFFSITAVVDTGLEMEILIGIFVELDCPVAVCSVFESVVVLMVLLSLVLLVLVSKRSSVVLEVLVLSLSVVTLNTVSLS